jgi:hypothetical protein
LSEENNAIKQFLEVSRDKNYCLLPCNDKQEVLKIIHGIIRVKETEFKKSKNIQTKAIFFASDQLVFCSPFFE